MVLQITTPSKKWLEYRHPSKNKPWYREAWFLVALAAASIVIIIMVVAILCVKSKSYKYKGKNPQLFIYLLFSISFSDKDIDSFVVLSCSVMITMCYYDREGSLWLTAGLLFQYFDLEKNIIGCIAHWIQHPILKL